MNSVSRRHHAAPVTVLDEALLWAITLLLSISLVMVYSASIAYAEADAATNNRYFYLFRHMIFMTIGLAGAWITFQIPTAMWKQYAGKFLLFSGFLRELVLIG